MKHQWSKLFFIFGFIIIAVFYFWSRMAIVSIILLIIVDSFTTKILPNQLKNIASEYLYKIIKYSYFVLFPIVIAIFIRTFLFDIYFVPSSSMEKTLFPNDYVIINKIKYGVKVPNHLRNVPVVGRFFNPPKNEYSLYSSLKAINEFRREDIVVFKAVDNSDKFLIKRIVGLPNDTIQIKQTKLYINSKELKEKDNYSYKYAIKDKGMLTGYDNFSNKEFNEKALIEKEKYSKNIKVKPSYRYFIFPSSKQEQWTKDNYGELVVPKKGMKIKLTKENIENYSRTAIKFENINLSETKEEYYTFKNNYFFMMGDNRHNSVDSRSFGFVPESYIQGKMIQIFSKR